MYLRLRIIYVDDTSTNDRVEQLFYTFLKLCLTTAASNASQHDECTVGLQ